MALQMYRALPTGRRGKVLQEVERLAGAAPLLWHDGRNGKRSGGKTVAVSVADRPLSRKESGS